MTGASFVSELVSLSGENELEPHPQNEISVPFRGSFQNFRRSPRLFTGVYEISPPGYIILYSPGVL